MNYTNHNGGARGSDIAWEIIGKKYGVITKAYSFREHKCLSPSRVILSDEELQEGWELVLICAKKMKRYIGKSSKYVRRLLSRNWFQVKNSESIYAIGRIIKPGEKGNRYKNTSEIQIVDGGTGYAVMMGIETKKNVFVFDQYLNQWYKWYNWNNKFEKIEEPKLTENFAGIGTRELNKNGIDAIKSIYKNSIKKI